MDTVNAVTRFVPAPNADERIFFKRVAVDGDDAISRSNPGAFGGTIRHNALRQLGVTARKILVVEAQLHGNGPAGAKNP